MSDKRPMRPLLLARDRVDGDAPLSNEPDELIDRQVRRDLVALGKISERELPSLDHLAAQLSAPHQTRTRANEKQPRTNTGERIMATKPNRKMWLRIAAVAFVFSVVGVVFATTGTGWISFWVETDGKSDEQLESEIEDQLIEGGMTNPEVDVDRSGGETRVEIEGEQGGKHIKMIKQEIGGDPAVIQMQHEPLDTEREPGMTDEQLRQKILAQLAARGMTDAVVEIDGNGIRVKVEKEVEVEPTP